MLVANVCETPGISHSHRKSDPVDAEKLARYARVDPRLLSPIRHRTEEAQHDLVLIRVRERFIAARTMFINAARGIVKSLGYRLPGCGADSFAKRCRLHLPTRVADILAPLLNQVASLTEQIKQYDALIEQLANSKYPETLVLQGVSGVGALTALSYVLTLGDPARFTKSRDVLLHRLWVTQKPYDPFYGVSREPNPAAA